MKKNLFFLVSVCLSFSAVIQAQDLFTVVKVTGNIVIERTGSPLGTGTSFSQNENLIFKIPNSRASVFNPDRGRVLITSESLSSFKTSKSNFLPPAGKISTRALTAITGIKDLKNHFGINYLILDETKLKIDTTVYPLAENRFFLITYTFKDRQINRKLPFKSDTIYLIKNEILTVDGMVIADSLVNSMKLAYCIVDKGEYSANTISTFTPVFPDIKTLGREVKVISDLMAGKSSSERMNEVTSYVKDFYGNFDEACLQRWLFENFGIR